MPRNFPKSSRRPQSMSAALHAVRLQIEREKLTQLKAETAALAPVHTARPQTLDERLKGYAPSAEELEALKTELAERQARLSLNDIRYFKQMLVHRRENGCNDIALLESELRSHVIDARQMEKTPMDPANHRRVESRLERAALREFGR